MRISPTHPGIILVEEFLEPRGISRQRLAEGLSFSLQEIDEIIAGSRNITAEVALRLGCFLGTWGQFWLNLQVRYDVEIEVQRT